MDPDSLQGPDEPHFTSLHETGFDGEPSTSRTQSCQLEMLENSLE